MSKPQGPSRVSRRVGSGGKASAARAREAYYTRFRRGRNKHNPVYVRKLAAEAAENS